MYVKIPYKAWFMSTKFKLLLYILDTNNCRKNKGKIPATGRPMTTTGLLFGSQYGSWIPVKQPIDRWPSRSTDVTPVASGNLCEDNRSTAEANRSTDGSPVAYQEFGLIKAGRPMVTTGRPIWGVINGKSIQTATTPSPLNHKRLVHDFKHK